MASNPLNLGIINKIIKMPKNKIRTNWQKEAQKLRPFVFKILTPNGYGTGFLIFKNNKNICGVATAYHVIAHAVEWNEPIKLKHFTTNKEMLLPHDAEKRVIRFDQQKDLALIMFVNTDFQLEDDLPDLTNVDEIVDQGVEIGWNGFPVIAQDDLCFFSGRISCFLNQEDSYLVDGVAINGVSGAPAFFIDEKTSKLKICGLISDYFSNNSTGQSLPGLSKIRSVTLLKKECENLKSMDEANEGKEKTN